MGINISATNFVTLDHTHQKRVDTSLENNPTFTDLSGIHVHHIFRRNQNGDKDRDGNPLIKALKGMGGYQIIPMYRQQIMERAREVLVSFASDLAVDVVMPMPSGYGFAKEVAELICDVAHKEFLDPKFIRKRTVSEMLAEYDGNVPANLNGKLARKFKSQLADWRLAGAKSPNQMVTMKKIDTRIRTCFQPLTLTKNAPGIEGQRVLVVDDLMSSGASIASVAGLLTQDAGCAVPAAICFLSSL